MANVTQISYRPAREDSPLKTSSGDNKDIKGRDQRMYDNTAFEGDTHNGDILPTVSNHHNYDEITVSRHDDDITQDSKSSNAIQRIQNEISTFLKTHIRICWMIFDIVFILAYCGYFSYAMYYRFGDEGSWRLMIVTVICFVGILVNLLLRYLRLRRPGALNYKKNFILIDRFITKIRLAIILPILAVLGLTAYVVVEIAIDRPRNLVSLGGLAFFIISFYIFSINPAKVKFRPVFWGVTIQLIFAILILRTFWGRDAFQWLGDRVTEFLAYTDAGSQFLFKDLAKNGIFAFQVLPVVVYFSTVVAILYYLGVMQVVIKWLGMFLAFCLGTSPTESVNAAGNIFLGQTEAPLMIRPFLADMTNSEIHAVMTGGFATISGSVMAAYIVLKIPANHLLTASVMSAPAALAMSKLFYPETEKSKHAAKDVYNMAKGTEHNIIEAASNGASMSINLVANIAVNLIAFVAMLTFVNATLVWFGDRVGVDNLTFQFICSYVFWPVSFLMGVDQADCRVVGELIGTKTFLNEFIAYNDLSNYIKNRIELEEYLANATHNVTSNLTGIWTWTGNDIHLNDTGRTLTKGIISSRSMVIATYALCGFSNLSSMGSQLGALGAMAPNRKNDMSKIVFRAMIAGNVACFLTACVAGLFYEED